MLRVLLDRPAWSGLNLRPVALQADAVAGQPEVGVIRRAVDVVARRTPHAFQRHLALYVIVALHPVLVSCAIGPVRECLLAEVMLLEHPGVAESIARLITDRPVVVHAV